MTHVQEYIYDVPSPPRERIPPVAILAGLFILATVTFSSLPGFNYVAKGIGWILALAYAMHIFRRRTRIPGELYVYLAWFLWAGGTGALITTVPILFWGKLQTVFQIMVLLAILSGFTQNRKVLSFNLVMFLIAAFIVCGLSFASGEYRRAETGDERLAGTLGANGFGIVMVMATACMAYLWMLPTRFGKGLKYALLIPGMAVSAVTIVLSGSRKSLVGLALFYVAWVFYCYRKQMFKSGRILIVVFLGIGLGGYGIYRVSRGTQLADRMTRTWQFLTGEGDRGGGEERLELYRIAGEVIAEHPLVGVGLDHYKLHSAGISAHSEYAEITADTGLIGAALYFPWYFILWWRCGKIRKWSLDPNEYHIAGLIRALIVVLLVFGFGAWFYDNKFSWIVMGSLIGYSTNIWARIRDEMRAGQYYEAQPHELFDAGYATGA